MLKIRYLEIRLFIQKRPAKIKPRQVGHFTKSFPAKIPESRELCCRLGCTVVVLAHMYTNTSTLTLLYNIREPRYKLHNMGYHIPNYAVTHQRALGHSSFSRLSMHNGKGSPHKWFRVDGVINTVPLGINKQDQT